MVEGGTVKVTGSVAMVTCDESKEVYKLHCHGNKWTGNVNKCSGERYSKNEPT